jgi:nucleotide-binding universal stress UspA family protein
LKRFLLATDLSARSDRALERSLELAALHNANLTVLHVIDEDLPPEVQTQLADAAETQIETLVAKAALAREFDVSVCVTPGREHLTIVDAAARDGCDLIILGRHRDESADRPLRGTTMERVLRQGQTPVLVVADRTGGPYENVMVGVDFSVFSRIALKVALAVAPGADFHFVHAFQVPFEGFLSGDAMRSEVSREREAMLARVVNEEMDILLQGTGPGRTADPKLHRVIRNGEVISVLRSEAARIKPDLVVIGTHGRVGIAHALLGSVAENLLNHPPCDVLAVKAW